MERRILICLLVLSLAWRSYAQNLGLILGITFSVVGVFIGLCIPLLIFLCVICGGMAAYKRSNQPRSIVVAPGPSQHPQPGSYPVQGGVTYPSSYPSSYPAQVPAPYPTAPTQAPYPTDPTLAPYPTAPTQAPYPTDPTLTSEQPPPYSVAAAYPPPPPTDTKEPL